MGRKKISRRGLETLLREDDRLIGSSRVGDSTTHSLGALDTENDVLVARGTSSEFVQRVSYVDVEFPDDRSQKEERLKHTWYCILVGEFRRGKHGTLSSCPKVLRQLGPNLTFPGA